MFKSFIHQLETFLCISPLALLTNKIFPQATKAGRFEWEGFKQRANYASFLIWVVCFGFNFFIPKMTDWVIVSVIKTAHKRLWKNVPSMHTLAKTIEALHNCCLPGYESWKSLRCSHLFTHIYHSACYNNTKYGWNRKKGSGEKVQLGSGLLSTSSCLMSGHWPAVPQWFMSQTFWTSAAFALWYSLKVSQCSHYRRFLGKSRCEIKQVELFTSATPNKYLRPTRDQRSAHHAHCEKRGRGVGGRANVIIGGCIFDQKCETSTAGFITVHTLCSFNQIYTFFQFFQEFQYSIINQRIKTEIVENGSPKIAASAWTLHNIVASFRELSSDALVDQHSGVPVGFVWKDQNSVPSRPGWAGKTLGTQLSVPVPLWHCADQLIPSDGVSGAEDSLDAFFHSHSKHGNLCIDLILYCFTL